MSKPKDNSSQISGHKVQGTLVSSDRENRETASLRSIRGDLEFLGYR